MPLTFRDVAEILKLIDASQCEELVLEIDGTRLVVRRSATASAATAPAPTVGAIEPAPAPSGGNVPGPTAPAARAAATEPGLVEVRAPMVGTFYRRPSPDEPCFVEEGQPVRKGDPLCLIEVMKLFTTIEAPTDGTIVAILAEDRAFVEFDQLLFRIRP